MSGLEVAGLVIGAIPIIVEFLKSTASGVESVRLFQSQRFRRKVQDWSTELLTQQTLLLNNIVLVLDTTDALGRDVASVKQALVTGSVPQVFYDKDVQSQLRQKLGHNYLPFEQNVLKVQGSILEVKKRLSIDEWNKGGTASDVKFYDTQCWKNRRDQIKVIFGQKVYNELLVELRATNDNLDRIRQHAIDLDTTSNKSETYTKPLQRLRQLRQEARELFAALTCAKCWNCRCAGGHGILLHMDVSRYTKPVDEPQYTISLADPTLDFSVAINRNLRSFYIRSSKLEDLSVRATKPCTNTNLPRPRVTFAQPAHNVNVVVSMQTSQPRQSATLAEIETLCSILAQYSTACQSIGYLKLTPGAVRRHEVLPANKMSSCAGMQTLSLSSKLCSLPSCQQRTGNPAILEVDDRLLLAATVVTNIFQLRGNWLDYEADGRNIIVPISASDNDTLVIDQLHVVMRKSCFNFEYDGESHELHEANFDSARGDTGREAHQGRL